MHGLFQTATQRFSRPQTSVRRRGETREKPFLRFPSQNLTQVITASDWIGAFKGPNVWAQKLSRVSPHARSWARKPSSGFQRVQAPAHQYSHIDVVPWCSCLRHRVPGCSFQQSRSHCWERQSCRVRVGKLRKGCSLMGSYCRLHSGPVQAQNECLDCRARWTVETNLAPHALVVFGLSSFLLLPAQRRCQTLLVWSVRSALCTFRVPCEGLRWRLRPEIRLLQFLK